MEELKALSVSEARGLMEALRKGAVPARHLPLLSVGRQKWLHYVLDDLREYISKGGSKVRFVNGDYGDGKTHTMALIKALAEGEGFATGFVVLTRDVPMQKFELVYQALVQSLSAPGCDRGIRGILQAWIRDNLTAWSTHKEGWGAAVGELAETLRQVEGLDTGFAAAVCALARLHLAPLDQDEDTESRGLARETLWRWFEGERVSKRDLKPFQIFESLSKTNTRRWLASLVALLRWLGHTGLIVFVDELEIALMSPTSARSAAFENVRLMIDNADELSHLQIFFSIIPDVLISERGFRSYDALWSRVRSLGEDQRINYRGVLIDLHRTPLSAEEMAELGRRLRQLHELAYGWEAGEDFGDALIEQICTQQERAGLLSEVRLFIRQILRALDVAEQGEGRLEGREAIAENLLGARRDLAQERLEPTSKPSWDS